MNDDRHLREASLSPEARSLGIEDSYKIYAESDHLRRIVEEAWLIANDALAVVADKEKS